MIMRGHKIAWLRPLLSAAILATGFGTVWLVAASWLDTTFEEATKGKNRLPIESVVVTAEGMALVESIALDDRTQVHYRDLNGREHDAFNRRNVALSVILYGRHGATSFPGSRLDWPQRIKRFATERESAEAWYFVHDGKASGSGYFVGYERISNRLIGYIGLAGFRRQSLPPGERIPARGAVMLGYASWSSASLAIASGRDSSLRADRWDVPPQLVHVPSGNLLRVVDLAARTTRTVFEAPTPIDSVGVPDLSSYLGRKVRKELPVLVRAGATIYRLDHEYNVIGKFAVPAKAGRQGAVTWCAPDSGRAVAVFSGVPRSDDAAGNEVTPTIVSMIGDDGAIQETHRIALRTGTNGPNERAQSLVMALSLPAPLVLFAADWSVMAVTGQTGASTASFAAVLKKSWPFLAATLAVSSVLAMAAWRRCRRFGIARPAVWVVFVILFGVPAFAGFLLHRRWTTGDRRARTEFESPALKGIEIFA